MKVFPLFLVLACLPQAIFADDLNSGIATENFAHVVISVDETGATEYELDVDGCKVNISIHVRNDKSYVSNGYRIEPVCDNTPYKIKLKGWAQLLRKAKEDGLLNYLARVGPGPGPHMCEGDLKARLVKAISKMHVNNTDVIKNVKSIWEAASTFDEYLKMFSDLGFNNLGLAEVEGVVTRKIGRQEILKIDPSATRNTINVPCNAMTYFEPR